MHKIPTTIITGFLGAGKTTLVRHILEHSAGRQIAVIVNEFGELGIDGEILKGCSIGCTATEAQGRVYELANGCLCCTVQEEFLPVMRELVARRAQLEHILIETSGLALPKPLVQAFNWPEVKHACTVDALITVVDGPALVAGQFAADLAAVEAQRRADPELDHQSPLHELFEDQLSCADLVILNKADQMDSAQLQHANQLLRAELPPAVSIVHASHGQVALELLLGLECATEADIHQRQTQHEHEDGEDHDHAAFDSIVLSLPETDPSQLLAALSELATRHTLYRCKGFVAVPGKASRALLQGVGTRMQWYYDRPWRSDEQRQTRLVLIGLALDVARLDAELRAALS